MTATATRNVLDIVSRLVRSDICKVTVHDGAELEAWMTSRRPLPEPARLNARQPAASVNQPRPENALLTIEMAAAILQVSPKLVRVFVREGSLRIITLGQKGSRKPRVRIQREDLDEFIEQRVTRNIPSCPSTNRRTRRTTNTTSSAEVIGFTARRNARIVEKPKR